MLRNTATPCAPFPGAIRIRGYWIRRGDNRIWIRRYRARRSVGHWIRGHWGQHGRGWRHHREWVPRHWREW